MAVTAMGIVKVSNDFSQQGLFSAVCFLLNGQNMRELRAVIFIRVQISIER